MYKQEDILINMCLNYNNEKYIWYKKQSHSNYFFLNCTSLKLKFSLGVKYLAVYHKKTLKETEK